MPFVKKPSSQGSPSPSNTFPIFIGRTHELHFFVQNILKPDEPTHNIISISGQGGVGKSTLLKQLINQTRSTDFKDYCFTALVDERQVTPLGIMEKLAAQLPFSGQFEKALRRYQEALRPSSIEHNTLQGTVVKKAPDIAGAVVEGIPLAGPLLREGTKAMTEHLVERYRMSLEQQVPTRCATRRGEQRRWPAMRFEEALLSLTRNRQMRLTGQ